MPMVRVSCDCQITFCETKHDVFCVVLPSLLCYTIALRNEWSIITVCHFSDSLDCRQVTLKGCVECTIIMTTRHRYPNSRLRRGVTSLLSSRIVSAAVDPARRSELPLCEGSMAGMAAPCGREIAGRPFWLANAFRLRSSSVFCSSVCNRLTATSHTLYTQCIDMRYILASLMGQIHDDGAVEASEDWHGCRDGSTSQQ